MKYFLLLLLFSFMSSCSQQKFEGVYEFNYESDSTFKWDLWDLKNIEFSRCSFINEIKFENEICYIKYSNLGLPMNLSSKFAFQDSIISFENPQFSEFGFGFFEVLSNEILQLGNCTFTKKKLSFELDNIEGEKSLEGEEISQKSKSETKSEPAKQKAAVNESSTTNLSPIRGEEKAAVETNKPEPSKTVTTPSEPESERTTQKAPEKPKIDSRAVMGAGGTSDESTTPASGTGYSLDMAGWDFASIPNINDRVSLRSGRIVFKITVDSAGNLIQAIPLEYNVTNDVLSYYKQVVNQINFKKSGGAAADFSTGKITFVIKVD